MRYPDLYESLKILIKNFFTKNDKFLDLIYYQNNEPKIYKTDEFINCIELMGNNDEISSFFGKQIVDNFGKILFKEPKYCILEFLQVYIENFNKFGENTYDYLYNKLETLFSDEELIIREFAFLFNFNYCNGNEIVFSKDFKIRKLEPIEKEFLYLQVWDSEFDDFIIERIICIDKITDGDYKKNITLEEKYNKRFEYYKERVQLFNDLIKTLRVWKSSSVFRSPHISSEPFYFKRWVKPVYRTNLEKDFFLSPVCNLCDTDLIELISIFEKIRKLRGKALIATTRLDLGIERLTSEDKLIDYMIGLEALFSTRDYKTPSKEVWWRSAVILNKDQDVKKAYNDYEFLSSAYKVRCDVVHGSECDIKNFKINRLEELLRQSIKHYFDKPEQFENNILRNNKIIFD